MRTHKRGELCNNVLASDQAEARVCIFGILPSAERPISIHDAAPKMSIALKSYDSRSETFPRQNTEPGQILRHSFAHNGEMDSRTIVLFGIFLRWDVMNFVRTFKEFTEFVNMCAVTLCQSKRHCSPVANASISHKKANPISRFWRNNCESGFVHRKSVRNAVFSRNEAALQRQYSWYTAGYTKLCGKREGVFTGRISTCDFVPFLWRKLVAPRRAAYSNFSHCNDPSRCFGQRRRRAGHSRRFACYVARHARQGNR